MPLKYIIRSHPESFVNAISELSSQSEQDPHPFDHLINTVLAVYTSVPEYRSLIKQYIEDFVDKSGTCPLEWYGFIADSFPPDTIKIQSTALSYAQYTFDFNEYYGTFGGYYRYKSLVKLIENTDSDELLTSLILESPLNILPVLSELYHSPECYDKIKTKIIDAIIKSLSPLIENDINFSFKCNSCSNAAVLSSSLMSIPEVMLYLKQHPELLADLSKDIKQNRLKSYLEPFFALIQEDSLNPAIVAFNKTTKSSLRTKSYIPTLLAGFARTIISPDIFTELLFNLKYNSACFFFNSPCIANLDTKTIDRALKYMNSFKTLPVRIKPMFPVVTPPVNTYQAVSKYLSAYLKPQIIQLMSQLAIGFNLTDYLNNSNSNDSNEGFLL